MKFYGVGIKFGGTDDMWELFSKKNCWFMGYHEDEKPRLDKQIDLVKVGDVLIAKAYGSTAQASYYIRAIGIVTNRNKPENVPDKYKDRPGFTVIWIKHFKKPIPLSASEFNRGGVHTYTIHREKNDIFIDKIKEMMKYDYIEGIFIEDYIDIAKEFILDETDDIYDGEEITGYPDDMITIKDEDSFGRKIILIPFEVDEVSKNGLVLLVPERHHENSQMCLANMGLEILDADVDISETIEKMKKSTDWDKSLNTDK